MLRTICPWLGAAGLVAACNGAVLTEASAGSTAGSSGSGGSSSSNASGGGSATSFASSASVSSSSAGVGAGGGAPITFELFGPGGQVCEGGGNGWVRLVPLSDGGPTGVLNNEPNTLDCATCAATKPPPVACQPLTLTGVTTTWNGTYWQPGTRGPHALQCFSLVQATPGLYLADLCATSVPGYTMEVCASVMFEYPGPSPVVGKLQ